MTPTSCQAISTGFVDYPYILGSAEYTRDVRNELLIVLYLDIHVGHDKNNIHLSRFIQGLHNGV